MKVVFVTPEEPSILPLFFERVIPRIRDQVAAMVVVSPIYRNSSWFKEARRFIDAFGLLAFATEAIFYARDKAMDAVHRVSRIGKPRSVKNLARRYGLPLLHPENVNDPAFLEELRALDPDVIVSVSCPQIFRKDLLELPRVACINVHSSFLPDYRGMLPTFWVLANNEAETGVSVHFMSPGIDEGDIVLQRKVPIADDETLRSLMARCKQAAADLVLDALVQFETGTVSPIPNRMDEGRYFSFPKRQDVMRFRSYGRALR